MPGDYHLQIVEPPRSVVVTWDTSSSVGGYIPRILAAVRSYGDGLVPGRDALMQEFLPGTEYGVGLSRRYATCPATDRARPRTPCASRRARWRTVPAPMASSS